MAITHLCSLGSNVVPAHRSLASIPSSPALLQPEPVTVVMYNQGETAHTQFDSMKERECLVYRSKLLGRWRKWTLPGNRKPGFASSEADRGTCVYWLTQTFTGSKLSSNSWFLIIILKFFSYCIFAVCLVSSAWIKFLILQCYAATKGHRWHRW